MFCKHCGTKNPEGSLYCITDGLPLGENSVHAVVTKETTNFCKSCSHKNDEAANYCIACGVSLGNVTEKTGVTADILSFGNIRKESNQKALSEGLISKFTLPAMIHAAKFAGIALGILIILSFIGATMINGSLKELLANDEIMTLIGSELKFISATDLMMLAHLAGINYSVSLMGMEESLLTSGWISLFAILAAIGLVLAGYLVNRNATERTAIERIYSVLPVALIYSIIISIISTFSGVSLEVPDPTGFFGDIFITSNYSFSVVFFNSLVLSVIFTTIGTLIGMPSAMKGKGSNVGFGISIQRATLHTILGIAICIVLTIVTIGNNAELKELKEESPEEAFIVNAFLIQTGTYMWNLSHLGTLNFDVTTYQDTIGAKYSILGGPKAVGLDFEDSKEFTEGLNEGLGNTWYFLLIPILLHAWAGLVIRKSTSGNLLYEIGAYAIAFGVVNAIVFQLLKFSINTSLGDLFGISFGFSFIITLLFSTFLSFGIAYATVMVLNKNKQSEHFPQQQNVSNF